MKTYKQDNMTIHNADCMEIMAGYEDNYFDLAVVDPPFGIGMDKGCNTGRVGKYGSIHASKKWDRSIPEKPYFIELFRVSKNQIIWGANYFTEFLPRSKSWIMWDKVQPARNFAAGELAWTSTNVRMNIFRRAFNLDTGKQHPTQKPIALYNWIYANYAEEGQKILDTHGGSFSNAIAAHYAKMHFVGCELDEDYFSASIERIRKETRQQEFNF